jgi:hypothetical protein
MKTVAAITVMLAALEGLRAINHTLAYVVAALVPGWCLGRLWEAGTAETIPQCLIPPKTW